MPKKGNDTDLREGRSTIKMPPPLSALERFQAAMETAGFSPDQFKLNAVQVKTNGQGSGSIEAEMTLSLPPAVAERLIRLLTVKPLNTDKDTATFGNAEVILSPVRHQTRETKLQSKLPAKLWTDKELRKRSKPKSDVPDLT